MRYGRAVRFNSASASLSAVARWLLADSSRDSLPCISPSATCARREFTQKHGLPADEFFADSFTYAAEAEART